MSKDTEAERVALEVELANVLRTAPFPTQAAIASREANIARLEESLAALGSAPEPIAAQSTWTYPPSSVIVRDDRHGTKGFERPEKIVLDPSKHAHEFDSMLREYGEEIT